jgi:hypothetical protein
VKIASNCFAWILTRNRYEKPWTETPVKKRKWDYYIFWGGCLVGLIAGAFMCYLAWSGVPNNEVCQFRRGGGSLIYANIDSTASSSRTTFIISIRTSGHMRFKEAVMAPDLLIGQPMTPRIPSPMPKDYTSSPPSPSNQQILLRTNFWTTTC